MPAAVWLRPVGRQQQALQRLVDDLAAAQGTVAFAPHLTVCGLPEPAALDAAAAYVEAASLPLAVVKMGVVSATATPLRAVFIEIEDSPPLKEFRAGFAAIAGAPEPGPAHISLLYALDRDNGQPRRDLDAAALAAIARYCEARIGDAEFTLGRPLAVATDGDWLNVRSWTVIRAL
jgi:hypothetical protein